MKKLLMGVFLVFAVVALTGCVDEYLGPSLEDVNPEKFIVEKGEVHYYKWDVNSEKMRLKFQIESDEPIDIFIVPTDENLNNLQNGKKFQYIPELSREKTLSFSGEGTTLNSSHLVIVNYGNKDAKVSLKSLVLECYEGEETLKSDIHNPLKFISKEVSFNTSTTYYGPYPLAFYNTYYELGEPDITFNIINNGDKPATIKLTSEYQGYSNKAVTTETMDPKETKEINQTIPLIKDKIEKIKTKTKFSLHYTIEYDNNGEWKTHDEQTVMIDVYPMDTMLWAIKDDNGNYIPMNEYIAVFVVPKDESIMEVLSKAKEYHPERSLSGYQSEDVNSQVKAIYDALKYDYKVSYIDVSNAYGKDVVQKVRLPKESLKLKSTNCIDGSVLFASAIEALGMRPYIIILPEHAFVAWDIDENGAYGIVALETTMVGNANFEEALNEGNRELEENWDVLIDDDPWNGQIIDIKECREQGILPME